MKKYFLAAVLVLILASLAFLFWGKLSERRTPLNPVTGSTTNKTISSGGLPASNTLQLPSMEIDQTKKYAAVLDTSKGVIKIELDVKVTPITANNFVSLARKGFYNNTIFHRVIKDFMIQGGDPKRDGTGGPGYQFDDEPFDGEYVRGTVAMANAGPNTNGSQFFIMHKDYPLPKSYVIFGHLVEGLEVVDRIAESKVEISPSGEVSKPTTPIILDSVEIIEE